MNQPKRKRGKQKTAILSFPTTSSVPECDANNDLNSNVTFIVNEKRLKDEDQVLKEIIKDLNLPITPSFKLLENDIRLLQSFEQNLDCQLSNLKLKPSADANQDIFPDQQIELEFEYCENQIQNELNGFLIQSYSNPKENESIEWESLRKDIKEKYLMHVVGSK